MNAFDWVIRLLEWFRDYVSPARPDDPTPRPPVPVPPTPAPPDSDPAPPLNKTLLDLHNRYRQEKGVPLLAMSELLNRAAQKHADWMADNKHLSHKGQGGSSHHQRMADEGYMASISGENIAMGYQTAVAVMQGWFKSRGHRRNLLDKSYREAGFGFAVARNGSQYWVAVFGFRNMRNDGLLLQSSPSPHRTPVPLIPSLG